jgi:hypothetical protein
VRRVLHSHLPHLDQYYFIPVPLRRRFRRLMEEFHRKLEMSDLITRRRLWAREQVHHTTVWQVSGGSLVQRAVQGGEAFNMASGIRQLGVQKVPVASIAPTVGLSALSDDDPEFLAGFAARESRAAIRKQERVSLLAASRKGADTGDAAGAKGGAVSAGPTFLLDDDAAPGSSPRLAPVLDEAEVLLNMDLGGSSSMALALAGTSLENPLANRCGRCDGAGEHGPMEIVSTSVALSSCRGLAYLCAFFACHFEPWTLPRR